MISRRLWVVWRVFAVFTLVLGLGLLALPVVHAGVDMPLGQSLAELGLTETDILAVDGASYPVDSPRFYRFGDDFNGAPTISPDEAPFAVPTRIGLAVFIWPDDRVPDPAVIEAGGGLLLPIGDGILGDTEYIVGWAETAGPVPLTASDSDLEKSLALVLNVAGRDGWQQLDAFPGDTWRQGCCIIGADHGGGQWFPHITTVEPGNALLEQTDMNGFAFIFGSSVILGADRSQLLGDVPIDQIGYRVAFHYHDGTFGSFPGSSSIITTAPDIGGGQPFWPAMGDVLDLGSEPPVAVPEVVPEETPEVVVSPEQDDATGVVPLADDTAKTALTPTGDGGGLFWPWAAILGGLGLMAAGAGTYASGRRKVATTAGTSDDPGMLFVSGLLQLGTKKKTTLDADWRSLTLREASLQRRLKNQWLKARKDLAQAFADYEKAMGTFKENAVNVMSATTVFDKLITQGSKTVSTMKAVDFVWGVGQLGLAGVRVAIARWFKAPPNVPWGAVDEMTKAMDQKVLAKLADEAGVDLAKFMSRFADAEAGGRALVSAVAQARGWVPMADDAQGLIRRLLDAGTSVMGSPSSRMDPADLGQLIKWADEVPDFWGRLAKAADWIETGGWFPKFRGVRDTESLELLFRADDISFLRSLVDRARTGWKPPAVPDEFTGMPAHFPLDPNEILRVDMLRRGIPGSPPLVPTSTPTVLGGSGSASTPPLFSASFSDAPPVPAWLDYPGPVPPSVPNVLDGPGIPNLTALPTPAAAPSLPGWAGGASSWITPGSGWVSGVDAFNTISGTAKTASWLANPSSDAPLTLSGYARYHGIDPDLFWAANPPSTGGDVIGSLMSAVGRKAGWHQLPVDVAILCDEVLEEGKNAIASGSGGVLAAERLADLNGLCGANDFPHWLCTAYVNLPEAVVFPYCGDDAIFLETLCHVGGDYTACGEALGPVWESAIATTCGQTDTPSAGSPFAGSFGTPAPNTVLGNPLFRPVTKDARARHEQKVVSVYRNSTTSAYVGLEQVPLMFGNLDEKTSEFHFAVWTFENSVLATGWQVLTSPFETMAASFYSGTAYKELSKLLTTHSTQLDNMSSSFRAAGRAIDKIEQILNGVTAADGLIGGQAESTLGEILKGYQDLYDAAPNTWQQAHKDEFKKRKAHIRQKQYQLVRALRPIRTAVKNIPKLEAWLSSLRRKDGNQLDLVNPEVWVRLTAVAMQINAMIAEAFLSGARQPQRPPRRVPPKQAWDWDKMIKTQEEMERKKKTMPKAEWEALYLKTYGVPPIDY